MRVCKSSSLQFNMGLKLASVTSADATSGQIIYDMYEIPASCV